MIDMNYQIQPGYMVRFLSPLGYCHWGIIADTVGSDDKYQVISVNKISGKVHKQNFSDANKQQDYAVIPVENAWEVCQRAVSHIGENWSYGMATNNCEHFVQEIATGRRQSGQVRGATIGAIGGVLMGIGKGKDIWGIAIDALTYGGLGVVVNNALQQGGTQITHQPPYLIMAKKTPISPPASGKKGGAKKKGGVKKRVKDVDVIPHRRSKPDGSTENNPGSSKKGNQKKSR